MMMAPETVGLSRVSGDRIAQSSDGGEGGWSAYVERRTVSPGAGPLVPEPDRLGVGPLVPEPDRLRRRGRPPPPGAV